MHTVTRQPKAATGNRGGLAKHNGQRQPNYTGNRRNRQPSVILGPMIATACSLHLWALALDLMALYNRRAFAPGGTMARVEYGDGRKAVYSG